MKTASILNKYADINTRVIIIETFHGENEIGFASKDIFLN